MKKRKGLENVKIEGLPRDCAEFDALLAYMKENDCPVYETGALNPVFFRLTDGFYWRAQELYVFRKDSKAKLPAHDVYHHAVHHLLAKRFGEELRGRPRFTLLCECIATASEFYFNVINIGQGVWQKTEKQSLEAYVHGLLPVICDQDKASKIVMKGINRAVDNPFEAFRQAVFDGLEYYDKMLAAASRRCAGEKFDYNKMKNLASLGDYGFVITRYDFAFNVMYALAFAGRESSAKDHETVEQCLKILKDSKSFADFLERLGLKSLSRHNKGESSGAKAA